MRLAGYSDDELIEELKHRGVKMELRMCGKWAMCPKVIIGGVTFDLK